MAQVDYFLKLDGIDGESTDAMFPKWIELVSWSWGATNSASQQGGGTGKVSFQDINITEEVNAASSTIAQYCAIGKHLAWAEIDCRKAGDTPQVFLKIKIYDVLISSYNVGGKDAEGHPTEQVALNFAKIEQQYGAQDATGKVNSLDKKMGYDLRTNRTA